MKAHSNKVDLFELLGILLSSNLFGFPDPKAELLHRYQQSNNRRRLDELKQDALHVSVTSTKVRAPVDGVTESTAWALLEDTRTFCQFF